MRLLPPGAEAGKLAGLWLRLRCCSRSSGRQSTTLVTLRSPKTKDMEPLCHVWGRRLVHGRLRGPFLERQSPGHRTMWQTRPSPKKANHSARPRTRFQKGEVCPQHEGRQHPCPRCRGRREEPWLYEGGV